MQQWFLAQWLLGAFSALPVAAPFVEVAESPALVPVTEGAFLGVYLDESAALKDGATVFDVVEGSGAAEAGIVAGDVITRVGSTRVTSGESLREALAGLSPGDVVEIRILRDGNLHEFNVTLGGIPSELEDSVEPPVELEQTEVEGSQAGQQGYLGVAMAGSLDSESQGASITTVVEGSPADEAALEPGDVVTAVDGQEIGSAEDLVQAIQSRHPGDSVRITYLRDGKTKRAKVTLSARADAVESRDEEVEEESEVEVDDSGEAVEVEPADEEEEVEEESAVERFRRFERNANQSTSRDLSTLESRLEELRRQIDQARRQIEEARRQTEEEAQSTRETQSRERPPQNSDVERVMIELRAIREELHQLRGMIELQNDLIRRRPPGGGSTSGLWSGNSSNTVTLFGSTDSSGTFTVFSPDQSFAVASTPSAPCQDCGAGTGCPEGQCCAEGQACSEGQDHSESQACAESQSCAECPGSCCMEGSSSDTACTGSCASAQASAQPGRIAVQMPSRIILQTSDDSAGPLRFQLGNGDGEFQILTSPDGNSVGTVTIVEDPATGVCCEAGAANPDQQTVVVCCEEASAGEAEAKCDEQPACCDCCAEGQAKCCCTIVVPRGQGHRFLLRRHATGMRGAVQFEAALPARDGLELCDECRARLKVSQPRQRVLNLRARKLPN